MKPTQHPDIALTRALVMILLFALALTIVRAAIGG